MRKAILFTANAPQIAQAWLMLDSFRGPDRGAFDGDIWVLSTDLDDAARAYLDSIGVRWFVDPLDWTEHEMDWRSCVAPAPEAEARAAFETYRNKRMSKLAYIGWHAAYGADYDAVAICDNDLYAQKPLGPVFDAAANGCINYWREDYPMWPGTSLWRKDFRYRQVTGQWGYDPGLHEVNIGFIVARPDVMHDLFATLRARFPDLPPRLIRDDRWHDQDLTRVLRWQRPDLFKLLPEDTILHLCGGGMALVEERAPCVFYNRVTGAMPAIIHFGGGEWRNFAAIKKPYMVDPDAFFDNALHRPETVPALAITGADYWPGAGVLMVRGTARMSAPADRIVLSTAQQGVLGEAIPTEASGRDADTPDAPRAWDAALPVDALAADDSCIATLVSAVGRTTRTCAIDRRDPPGNGARE